MCELALCVCAGQACQLVTGCSYGPWPSNSNNSLCTLSSPSFPHVSAPSVHPAGWPHRHNCHQRPALRQQRQGRVTARPGAAAPWACRAAGAPPGQPVAGQLPGPTCAAAAQPRRLVRTGRGQASDMCSVLWCCWSERFPRQQGVCGVHWCKQISVERKKASGTCATDRL